jgi:hypothetical protein
MTLKWDYKKRTCDISMPGYVSNILSKFKHDAPRYPQHTPPAPSPMSKGEPLPIPITECSPVPGPISKGGPKTCPRTRCAPVPGAIYEGAPNSGSTPTGGYPEQVSTSTRRTGASLLTTRRRPTRSWHTRHQSLW